MKCKECKSEILQYGRSWNCECEDNDEWVLVKKEANA